MLFNKTQKTRELDTGGLSSLLGLGKPVRAPVNGRDVGFEFRVGLIGRGFSGKTTLVNSAREAAQITLPSSLYLGEQDPLMANSQRIKAKKIARKLGDDGLEATTVPELGQISLWEGARVRSRLVWTDPVGQLLPTTTIDSPAEQLDQYHKYVDGLAASDVILALVPMLANEHSEIDEERYKDDLRLVANFLREALRCRDRSDKVAIGLIFTKVDLMFADEADMRDKFTADRQRAAVKNLVDIVRPDDGVSEASIIPTSAMGFRTMVKADDDNGLDTELRESSGNLDATVMSMEYGEKVSVLQPGVVALEGWNVLPLLAWSFLVGIANTMVVKGSHEEEVAGRLCRMLCSDLGSMGGCITPVKGQFSL